LTTWAYRNGVLVADSMVSTSSSLQVVGTAKKVHKSKDGWLAAGAGILVDVHRFFRWVDEGRDEDEAIKLENLDGILISPEGDVYQIDDSLFPYQIDAEFHAGGGGAAIATGAMAFGATAEEAIKIAMKYSLGTGGKIQKVTL
jgi:hypothetical protein